MNRPMKFRLAAVALLILLYPFSAALARGDGQERAAVESGLSSEPATEGTRDEGMSGSPQYDEQARYRRILKEYEQSIIEAGSDEERQRLRRKFDVETREYRDSLTEEKGDSKRRDLEKERQALKKEYHQELRRLEQNHAVKLRRLEKERTDLMIGAQKNWQAQERTMDRKKPMLEEEFQRRLKSLKDDYDANLQKLQMK